MYHNRINWKENNCDRNCNALNCLSFPQYINCCLCFENLAFQLVSGNKLIISFYYLYRINTIFVFVNLTGDFSCSWCVSGFVKPEEHTYT